MSTIYDEAAIKATTEKMKDPKMAAAISGYFERLLEGEYPPSYVDIMLQKWRYPIDIYDAYSFAKLHAGLRAGYYALFQIPVKTTPFSDSDEIHNNETLSLLPYPFEGEFWGGATDHDGIIKWCRPINALVNSGKGYVGYVIVPPLETPLEVGYNSAHKLLCHLNGMSHGMARWPYGQKKITVLLGKMF